MLIVYGMPELFLLQSLSTSLSIALFPLSILYTTLLEENTTFSCDTMSESLLISVLLFGWTLLLSILGRFRISFLTFLSPEN